MVLIIVATDIGGEQVDVGDLVFTNGGSEHGTARFTYNTEFVRSGYPVDPQLSLDAAVHELPYMPLAFQDASPDAWGQRLLDRAKNSPELQEFASMPTTARYLLGASDATRQGALRFRIEETGPFLNTRPDVPHHLRLRDLQANADGVIEGDVEAVRRAIADGSGALGGARPKAAVVGDDGRWWLAKFRRPKDGDANDVPLWEYVGLELAQRAGLTVPERQLVQIDSRNILLVERFDRTRDGRRVPYISARTLMGRRRPDDTLDFGLRGGIAARLNSLSRTPAADTAALWRLAAFHLLVNNTDNHSRNIGFLGDPDATAGQRSGWSLAPVFDLDPNPDTGADFGTHIGGAAYRGSGLHGLFKIARDCRLDEPQAAAILSRVIEAIEGWGEVAQEAGAATDEIELMRDAFEGLLPDAKQRAAAASATRT